MMATCRFAHYLKSMMRDKVGSFMSRDDCWRFLNRWISQYVTQDDRADQATKAKFPLREARVDVEEIKGKPGCYRAISYLRPHFQLDEISVSLRQGSYQPERDTDLVQLKVRAKITDRPVAARLAFDLLHVHPRLPQRKFGLGGLIGIVILGHVLADPAIQEAPAVVAGHEAADLVAH